MDFPLGEGNFGIVYKGVRTKSDGDWEQVPAAVIGNLLIPVLGIRPECFIPGLTNSDITQERLPDVNVREKVGFFKKLLKILKIIIEA